MEQRHRFLLDVILRMTVLEGEKATVEDRLQAELDPEHRRMHSADNEEDGTVQEEPEDIEEMDEEDSDSTIRALREQQEKEAKRLFDELQTQKEKRAAKLRARLADVTSTSSTI